MTNFDINAFGFGAMLAMGACLVIFGLVNLITGYFFPSEIVQPEHTIVCAVCVLLGSITVIIARRDGKAYVGE